MSEQGTQEQEMPPEAQVLAIVMGQMTSGAVSALARLGVPDHLESGPKTAEELATLVGARPDLLHRLMRATEGLGILARTKDGKWAQTPMSDVLRTDSPKAIRDFAVFMADEWHVAGFTSLDETVRTGELALQRAYGLPYFEYFRQHPEAGDTFNRAMTAFSRLDAPAVVEAYDFSGIESLTDVAGGYGLMLTTILQRYPDIKATLYELPQVLQSLPPLNVDVADRIQLVEGNMFESIPPGADAYMMKRIIHDWPDEMCARILRGCREGVKEGGKLIVIDAVVPAGGEFSPSKIMDLTMMLFLGGKERTEEEFRALFASSGWKLNRIVPTASLLSVIEGVPA